MSPHSPTYLMAEFYGDLDGFLPTDLSQQHRSRYSVDSFELQHWAGCERLQTLVGIRYQYVTDRLFNEQVIYGDNAPNVWRYFGQMGTVITNQSLRLHSERLSPYLYEHFQVADTLWLIGGLSYDYQRQPHNRLYAPLSDGEEIHRQLSPKAGAVWTPTPRSAVRAAYTQSLNGNLEQSVRLEPSLVAGFVQAYRNLFPTPLAGTISGARTETADLSLEYRSPTRTYVAVGGEWLHATASHDVGAFLSDAFAGLISDVQVQERLRFQERSLDVSLHQLLGDCFNLGARYRIADVWLNRTFPGWIAPSNTRTRFPSAPSP